MSETATLRIHAHVTPPGAGGKAAGSDKRPPIQIRAAPSESARSGGTGRRVRRVHARLTRSERLMRNSAYACALLLGILALGNVNEPWAKRASDSVEQALTMRIDLDESIGALQFVKNLMPDSALVFMNLSGEHPLGKPVDGPLAHGWTHAQPWLMFNCAEGAEVRAAAPGTVTAVSPMSGDKYGVLVDHGEGVETLYAHLSSAEVQAGDAVARGQTLGRGSDAVYFEYRRAGESVDPTEDLGL